MSAAVGAVSPSMLALHLLAQLLLKKTAQACSTTHHIAAVADGLVAIGVGEVAAAVAAERGVQVHAAVSAPDNSSARAQVDGVAVLGAVAAEEQGH